VGLKMSPTFPDEIIMNSGKKTNEEGPGKGVNELYTHDNQAEQKGYMKEDVLGVIRF